MSSGEVKKLDTVPYLLYYICVRLALCCTECITFVCSIHDLVLWQKLSNNVKLKWSRLFDALWHLSLCSLWMNTYCSFDQLQSRGLRCALFVLCISILNEYFEIQPLSISIIQVHCINKYSYFCQVYQNSSCNIYFNLFIP